MAEEKKTNSVSYWKGVLIANKEMVDWEEQLENFDGVLFYKNPKK